MNGTTTKCPFCNEFVHHQCSDAPHPLNGLREALRKIANPDHRTPGAECLWCMDDLPEHEDWCAEEHEDWCAAAIARAALRDEGETT